MEETKRHVTFSFVAVGAYSFCQIIDSYSISILSSFSSSFARSVFQKPRRSSSYTSACHRSNGHNPERTTVMLLRHPLHHIRNYRSVHSLSYAVCNNQPLAPSWLVPTARDLTTANSVLRKECIRLDGTPSSSPLNYVGCQSPFSQCADADHRPRRCMLLLPGIRRLAGWTIRSTAVITKW